jgi:hypothetical protein
VSFDALRFNFLRSVFGFNRPKHFGGSVFPLSFLSLQECAMIAKVNVRRVLYVAALCCAFAHSFVGESSVQAGTIGVNFLGGAAGSNVGANSAGFVPAVGWNDVAGGTQTNLALLDNLGANSGVTLSYSGLIAGTGNATSIANVGDSQMSKGNVFIGSNQIAELVLEGTIPYAVYDLYVYYNGGVGANDSQNYTIVQAALTKLAVDGALLNETGFIESNGVNEGNFIRFSGLNSSTLPSFKLRAQAVVGQYGYFNGFQIVDTTPVSVSTPEPASVVLLGLGCLFVVRRSRRHRQALSCA